MKLTRDKTVENNDPDGGPGRGVDVGQPLRDDVVATHDQ